MPENYYRRNLPHWHPPGVPLFFTFQLYGSLPAQAVRELICFQKQLEKEIAHLSRSEQEDRRLTNYKRVFARLDATLDKAATGPLWLQQPEIASMVERALLDKYSALYEVWAYVVMANHVHLLITPKFVNDSFVPARIILQRIQGYTARQANKILGRVGIAFWQDESFDHWTRDDAEFNRLVAYIENNPVKAGLVTEAENWMYSSARERRRRNWRHIRSYLKILVYCAILQTRVCAIETNTD